MVYLCRTEASSEEQSAAMEEIAAAATHLAGLVQELSAGVRRFRVS